MVKRIRATTHRTESISAISATSPSASSSETCPSLFSASCPRKIKRYSTKNRARTNARTLSVSRILDRSIRISFKIEAKKTEGVRLDLLIPHLNGTYR